MWIIQVHETGKPLQEFFFKGPVCKIGRSLDLCDLCFLDDKSISRNHAELLMVMDTDPGVEMPAPSTPKLYVKDLGSRFGSSLNGLKLETHTLIEIPLTGGRVQLGGGGSYVQLTRTTLALCPTRLQKPEKIRLKMLARLLQAKIVPEPSAATHLITTRIAATVKSLIAIATQMKIVSLDWLSFAETSKNIEPIPPAERYFPPLCDEVRIVDVQRSRKSLLDQLHILLLNDCDIAQYDLLMKACGATVTHLSASIDQRKSIEETFCTVEATSRKPGRHKTLCLFFDENRGVEPEVEFASQCKAFLRTHPHAASDGSLSWLTAANLASSIMECQSPQLTIDAPNRIRLTGYSQSQQVSEFPPSASKVVAVETRLVSDSQLFSPSSQAPLITAPTSTASIAADPLADSLRSASDLFPKIVSTDSFALGSKKRFYEQLQDNNSSTAVTSDPKKLKRDDISFLEISLDRTIDESLSCSNLKKSAGFGWDDDVIESPMKLPAEVSARKEPIAIPTTSFADALRGSARKRPLESISSPTASCDEKTSRQATQLNFNSGEKLSIPLQASDTDCVGHHFGTDAVSEHIVTPITDDGWISVVRGVHQLDLLVSSPKESPQILKSEMDADTGEMIPPMIPPITIERPLLRSQYLSNSTAQSTSSASSESSAYAGSQVTGDGAIRNRKQFSKNFVCCIEPEQRLHSQQMNRVLPKESEREIQLRLEYETAMAKENEFNTLSFETSVKNQSSRNGTRKR